MSSRKRSTAHPERSDDGDYQVGPGMVVVLVYEVYDEEGELVDSSGDETLEVVIGYGQMLSSLENGILGLRAGSRRSIGLAPKEAYGEWEERAVIHVDRTEFPPATHPGDRFEVENDRGAILVFKVLDVAHDHVVLDTNHPLAGQSVRFSLEVRSVRPATSQELAAAESLAVEGPGGDGPSAGSSDLIPPRRLLQRRPQR